MRKEIKMLITDLDGTLTVAKDLVSEKNISALEKLGEENITRVVATGRSYFSMKKFIPDDFPIDYLIFSTGVGIMNWNTKKIINKISLENKYVEKCIEILTESNFDFMVHYPVPENHKFKYYSSGKTNHDFNHRIEYNKNFAEEFRGNWYGDASQLVVVLSESDEKLFENVRNKLAFAQIIKTTSPINNKSIWMEIFKKGVTKAHGAAILSELLKIEPTEIVSIGNDYNDIELLDWSGTSYILANAPQQLKLKYKNGLNNFEDGFAEVVNKYFRFL